MHRKIYLLFGISLVLCDDILVTVKQGKLIGARQATVFQSRTYFAFYGVPYAQRPTGKMRFKDPLPPKKWKYTFDASLEYHGACAQPHIVHQQKLYGFEDCLRLNIYTPELPREDEVKLKPVIVWIHGYTFTSSNSQIHGADFLIDNDVLLITVSHRIGVFGFLKLDDDDSNANMGLKDIVMALKWIRKNVQQFGGDKKKITLMGNNSAATFISLLLLTDARKLFSKIILQSGSIFAPSIFQGDHKLERQRLISELKNEGLTLNEVTAKQLVLASQKIYSRKEFQNTQRHLIPFTPIVEKESNSSLLTKTVNEFHEVVKTFKKPILIGFNTQEGIAEIMQFIHNPLYLRLFAKIYRFLVPFSDGCKHNVTSKIYKDASDAIKNKYFKTTISEMALDNFLKYASDVIIYPVLKFIRTVTELSKSKVFVYKFGYEGTLNAVKNTVVGQSNTKVKGVAGGDEICYILKCEPLWEYYKAINTEGSRDKQLINQLTRLWTNFAKYGDPTPSHENANLTWPQEKEVGSTMLSIKKSMRVLNSKGDKDVLSFWDNIYEKYYREEHCKRQHDEL